ncbi:MAG: PilZ domain-containing protein [Phycisphaerales bacterium]|nr:PilZ domain-containing protein [Phycisphaerales bacterium]
MLNSWNTNHFLRLHRGRGPERRQCARFHVEPMYSSVRVREIGALATPRNGHLYDLSMRGMRFEIDEAIAVGTELEIEIHLPALRHAVVLRAHVVREDSEELLFGPMSVAVEFGRDARGALARKALARLLAQRWLQLAA